MEDIEPNPVQRCVGGEGKWWGCSAYKVEIMVTEFSIELTNYLTNLYIQIYVLFHVHALCPVL